MNCNLQRLAVVAGLTLGILAALGPFAAGTAAAEPVASDWTLGHKSRTRLTAARVSGQGPAGDGLYAFVEIELADGWKSYWKNPGESGIPPRFDFSKSANLGSAHVLYPAPRRIDDKGDTIIGYTGTLIFPVLLKPADPQLPVDLDALVQFGICKEICVPTEASLQLTVSPDTPAELTPDMTLSLERVPRTAASLTPESPVLQSVSSGFRSSASKITVTADFPGGTGGADAFLEAPDGLYLPYLTKTAESGSTVTFEAGVSKDVDLAALAGKTISVTIVSDAGASEASFKFE